MQIVSSWTNPFPNLSINAVHSAWLRSQIDDDAPQRQDIYRFHYRNYEEVALVDGFQPLLR